MGRLFQPMGRRNHPQKKHNKKNTNKYSNNNQNESYSISKVKSHKGSKKSNPEQIFEIADEIFGSRYFCMKDL